MRRRGGGFYNAVATIMVFFLLGGGGLAWINVNNIESLGDVYDHLRGWSHKTDECSEDGVEGLANCDYIEAESSKGDKETPKISADEFLEIDALEIVDVETLPDETIEVLSEQLEALNIAEPSDVDYVRSDWKHWTGSPCNTRQEVLLAQGDNVEKGDRCKILSGTWIDPFSNQIFEDSSKLDIDHVIPLGYAAKMGGNNWEKAVKEEFANDKIHLLAVSASENRSKGDKGPGAYMPPNKEFHCAYSKIWISTTDKYGISITSKDKAALQKALKSCR